MGIVPLVQELSELHFETVGSSRFRVGPAVPRAMEDRAVEALKKGAKLGCDVVVFPELCLTQAGQARLMRDAAAGLGLSPW